MAIAKLIVPTVDAEAERKKLLDRVGDLSKVQIFGNRVLVAKFIRDRIGSIAVSDRTRTEDKWQGKVGIVLKKGHLAFKSDANNDFGTDDVKVGDWVLFSYSDGTDFELLRNGHNDKIYCRVLKDIEVQGVVPSPEIIW
jgi:hypothetical protein